MGGRTVSKRRALLVDPLSERELEVLRLLASELDGPGIARELVVSLNTVRTHTKHIYTKLAVNSRRSAVTARASAGTALPIRHRSRRVRANRSQTRWAPARLDVGEDRRRVVTGEHARRPGHPGARQRDAGTPGADRLGVPEALLEQQHHPGVERWLAVLAGLAVPDRQRVGAGTGLPAISTASYSTERVAAKVRCTAVPSGSFPPYGATTSGTMPAAGTGVADSVEATQVAVGVDDDPDDATVARPGRAASCDSAGLGSRSTSGSVGSGAGRPSPAATCAHSSGSMLASASS